ncbi:MAG: hypothetical protein DRQ47_08205 [Gammaproteobacteria bacterium]|nr:MAG: hypothetical protein DRQ47_08205 [Gammaproteobacteria bacterium]
MKNTKSTLFILSALLAATYASSLMASEPVTDPTEEPVEQIVDEKCQAPKWAIAIGHEDKWKLHNGCTDENAEEKKQKTTQ